MVPAIRLSVSLDAHIAALLRRRASETRQPASRYLAGLIEADAAREMDLLAAEGYRMLSSDTGTFAEAAAVIASDTWPEWHAPADEASGE